MSNRQNIADDLFAGAGGWDLAAAALGIEARGVEIMPAARATREAAGLSTQHDDVWTFVPDGKAAGLIASPPCQTFSPAGKGAGRKAFEDVHDAIERGDWRTIEGLHALADKVGDPRTALVLTPLHFALTGDYEWVAWEQVTTVLPVWEACAVVMRAEGWHVVTGIVNAEQHGVPQTRRRAVLLGRRDRAVKLPTPTHSRFHNRSPEKLDPDVLPWVSMWEAIEFGLSGRPSPTITGGGTGSGGGAEPIAKLARYVDRPDFGQRVHTGQNSRVVGGTVRYSKSVDVPAPTVTGQTRSWRIEPTHMGDVYNSKGCVRTVDEPAPTMTAAMDNGNFRWENRHLAPAGTSSTLVDPRPVDEPAATITGKGTAEWGERATRAPGPKQRDPKGQRVTVEEAGVLQTFPADWPWQGTKSDQYLQAGNAIPPLLALALLSEVATP